MGGESVWQYLSSRTMIEEKVASQSRGIRSSSRSSLATRAKTAPPNCSSDLYNYKPHLTS
ncbi:jg53 [Pararge aegeria aegeria]|uniref:Jg53 protein n=1 Tax=Pararge aegeria aegeria TaxID=348720 RepID=A0A8S4QEP0_9NEOP|nr:jg53 [Pararge aegeria aegeria]